MIVLALSGGTVENPNAASAPEPARIRVEAAAAPAPAPAPRMMTATNIEAWMIDTPERRPAALPAMYATLGALQALDVYSTRKAIGGGAYEANPLMKQAAKNSPAMFAAKAVSTAAAIYFAERAWKKNKKGAVILMAAINGGMAAIVGRNLRNAR